MTRMISRRRMLKGTGAAVASALLGACGGSPTAPALPKTTRETVTVKETMVVQQIVTAAPATGPTNALGVVLPADALPIEQQFWLEPVGQVGGLGHIMESLYNRAFDHAGGYETLTTLDNDLNVVGVGTERWSVADDGLTWDFALRKELQFSDGRPVTAHDWVFTLQRALGNGYDFGWFYGDIKNALKVLNKQLPPEQLGIVAADDYTLRITTEAPTPYLPALGVWFGVAPRQAYAQYGDNWALDPATYISSGPFILKEFDRGVGHRWILNPSYKGTRRPYFAEIHAETLPTGLPAYLARDIRSYSVGGNAPAGEIGVVNANPLLRAESHPQPFAYTEYLGFNTLTGKFPPLDNPDVRMALCKANRQRRPGGRNLPWLRHSGLGNPAEGLSELHRRPAQGA